MYGDNLFSLGTKFLVNFVALRFHAKSDETLDIDIVIQILRMVYPKYNRELFVFGFPYL